MPRPFCLLLLATLLTCGQSYLLAEASGLESLNPAGGRAGERLQVKVLGKGLDKNNPVGWCSNPAVNLQPVPLTGDKTKDKLLTGLWHLTIAKDAAPGPCLIRFHNNDGSSPPHIFEVGTLPEYTEHEPNDSLKESSSSPLPTASFTLNGTLSKEGDVDTFPIRVCKDHPITFELHGYALGSSMDPAMRLLDERGIELAASHDTHNLDPLIRHTPTADATLFVQLFAFVHPPQSDIAFKGTPSHIYRLHVTESPLLSPSTLASAPAPSSSSPQDASAPLIPPFTLSALLPTPGQESHHTLHAKKGDDLQITVLAKSLHSPLEAVLRIESIAPDGQTKILQENDDTASSLKATGSLSVLDPSLRFKAPTEGDYHIIIADRFQTGSPDHRYELSVSPWQPTVTATLADHAYLLFAGKTADIKLTVTLNGKFPSKLIARATHLPPGITCADIELPTKSGEVKLTLKAAADAPPAQTPITIEILPATTSPIATGSASSSPLVFGTVTPVTLATYSIPFTEPRGDLLIPTDIHPWLTVPSTIKDIVENKLPPSNTDNGKDKEGEKSKP